MQKGIDHIGVGVTTLCHDGAGRYLLELRSDRCRDEHFCWSPVGSGGVKFGETIEAAIHREVKEECSASVRGLELLGVREVFRELAGRPTHWVQHDYLVQIDPAEVKIGESEKCLKLEWFSLKDFPSPMHSQWPVFFEQHHDKL